ncbi:MAG: EF-P lysine aminoacylase GenX [Chromatiaceae bacterium]|nr:MAG: EF-P lysine aminoacylase GenX [Chromatiaceae bacterium]
MSAPRPPAGTTAATPAGSPARTKTARAAARAAVSPDWRPCAPLAHLQARAALLRDLREFFADRGVLEVETPILSRAAATDPALASLHTDCLLDAAAAQTLYLHTSPEFPMKRLLAAGSGPIYQVCKVFRGGERGRRHHPEFSLLEWYRPGWSLECLMDEVAALVRCLLRRPNLASTRLTYRDLFLDHLDLDPWATSAAALGAHAHALGLVGVADQLDLDRDGWLDLLLTQCLEPGLGRDATTGRPHLTFLCDYPPSQAALARIRPGPVPVAARFELYLDGMELANGFEELTDADEQRARFAADLAVRARAGQPLVPPDEGLLGALAAGLPACAGVALGLDRLLMLVTAAAHIDAVLAFPVERA